MNKWVSKLITLVIFIGLFSVIIYVYDKYYFNDFIKANERKGATSYYRDGEERYSKTKSYCIESTDYNDALFFKKINVEKNTPYKITCMVKTENVESDKPETAGACISIMGTADQTLPIQGTNDWQKVTLLVDSKDSDTLDVSFRLGGCEGYSKGKVWFSDIHVEKGTKDTDKNWNVVCFLIDNVDVNLEGNVYSYSLTQEDKDLLKRNLERFAETTEEFSQGQMTVSYSTVEIKEPLTSLSYDEDNYYYVAPKDVKPLIDNYVKEEEYDHIFIGIRMGNSVSGIPVNDWIGLGSMRYDAIGFSDIRMPNDLKKSTMYKYNIKNDTFPEEVFVHEFLHSLERNLSEKGYTFPALHDNEKYGYESQDKNGLEDWYKAYMECNIDSSSGKTGLAPIVYQTKPVQESNFETSEEVEFENEPKNPVEAIIQIVGNFQQILSNRNDSEIDQTNYVTITSD